MNQPPQHSEQRPVWLPTEQEIRLDTTEHVAYHDAPDEEMVAWIAEANAAAAELAEELAARW